MSKTIQQSAYVADRFLAAFDDAQKRFSLTSAQMDRVCGGGKRNQIETIIRRFMIEHMATPDASGNMPSYKEIGFAMDLSAWSVGRYVAVAKKPVKTPDPERVAKKLICTEQIRRRRDTWERRIENMNQIIDHVCQRMGVPRSGLGEPTRNIQVVTARRLIASLVRSYTAASFPEIARATGRTSHTSIIEQHQSLAMEMAERPDQAVCGMALREWCEQLDHEVAEMLGVQTGEEQRRVA